MSTCRTKFNHCPRRNHILRRYLIVCVLLLVVLSSFPRFHPAELFTKHLLFSRSRRAILSFLSTLTGRTNTSRYTHKPFLFSCLHCAFIYYFSSLETETLLASSLSSSSSLALDAVVFSYFSTQFFFQCCYSYEEQRSSVEIPQTTQCQDTLRPLLLFSRAESII